MQRRIVDLPEPDGPMIETASPLSHVEVDALEHLGLRRRTGARPPVAADQGRRRSVPFVM